MNVHLTPELKKLVECEVASGGYSSASEVVREGLRLLLEERRWREDVRERVAAGMAEARLGKLLTEDEVRTRMEARLRKQ